MHLPAHPLARPASDRRKALRLRGYGHGDGIAARAAAGWGRGRIAKRPPRLEHAQRVPCLRGAADGQQGKSEGPQSFHSPGKAQAVPFRSEEHTSELQSLMRISYAVFCLKKKTK